MFNGLALTSCGGACEIFIGLWYVRLLIETLTFSEFARVIDDQQISFIIFFPEFSVDEPCFASRR